MESRIEFEREDSPNIYSRRKLVLTGSRVLVFLFAPVAAVVLMYYMFLLAASDNSSYRIKLDDYRQQDNSVLIGLFYYSEEIMESARLGDVCPLAADDILDEDIRRLYAPVVYKDGLYFSGMPPHPESLHSSLDIVPQAYAGNPPYTYIEQDPGTSPHDIAAGLTADAEAGIRVFEDVGVVIDNIVPADRKDSWQTSLSIIDGCIRASLLKADADGYKEADIGLGELDAKVKDFVEDGYAELNRRVRADAYEIVKELAPHLTSLSTIRYWSVDGYYESAQVEVFYDNGTFYNSEDRTLSGIVLSHIKGVGRLLNTPMPWPSRDEILRTGNVTEMTDGLGLFNPACYTKGNSTYLALVMFILIAAIPVSKHVASRPIAVRTRTKPVLAAGAACGMILLITMHGLRFLSPLFPGTLPTDYQNLLALAAILVISGMNGLAAGRFLLFVYKRFEYELETKERSPGKESPPTLTRDAPVMDLCDDRLNFRPMVNALTDFLNNKDTKPPLVMSINGPWGSGKSSVMRMLDSELKKTKLFRTVWFNAWQYKEKDRILAGFLKTIADEFSRSLGIFFLPAIAWARLKRLSLKGWLALLTPALTAVLGILLVNPYQALQYQTSQEIISMSQISVGLTSSAQLNVMPNILAWLASIGGSVFFVSHIRYLKPFALNFKKLFKLNDHMDSLGFFEEFKKEFALYRDAIGHDTKFVIFIDDLDRCPADEVVEVLKTINLVATGGLAAERTFFVLGFDSRHIEKSIKVHFKNFIDNSPNSEFDFGREYMKKMVTLQVSVPRPAPSKFTCMVDSLQGEQADTGSDPDDGRAGIIDIFKGRRRRLAVLVSALALSLAVFAATLIFNDTAVQTGDHNNRSELSVTKKIMPVEAGQSGDRFMHLPEEFTPLHATDYTAHSHALMTLLFLGAATTLITIARRSTPPSPPKSDSMAFIHAVRRCESLLPRNPRDTIRLVNRMRAFYLLQKNGDYGGSLLSEDECVIFSIIQYNHPKLFSASNIEKYIAGEGGIDFSQLGGSGLGNLSFMIDKDKLQRFLDVNYHILAGDMENTVSAE